MKTRRPRILFVSPIAPYPQDIGVRIRIHNMLTAAAQVGDVDFVGYAVDPTEDGWPSREMMDTLSSLCQSVRICPSPLCREKVGKHQSLKVLWHYALSRTPVTYADFAREPLVTLVEPLAFCADLIWVERLYVAHWLRKYSDKMIVDIDDLESVKLQRQLELEPAAFFRWALSRQQRKLEQFERRAGNDFTRLVICSQQDKSFWPEPIRNRIWVAPNGADERLFDYPRYPKEKNRLVFVGMLAYWPNEDAVLYFCREILPLIMRELPDVTLWIVGKDPPKSLLDLRDGERVHVVANVPDIAPYVQQSMLSVVPLRVGGGTRLKILESLALGTPVVSSTVGAEGLDLEDGKQLVLADTPDVFAAHVVALLRNPGRYKSLIEAGEAAVRRKYQWSDIQQQIALQIAMLAGEFNKCRRVDGDRNQTEQIPGLNQLSPMRGLLHKLLRLTRK